jgi:hypothetical protein
MSIFAQYKPQQFYLRGELDQLAKTTDENPTANSINDILVIGDTVWLATSYGLSYSPDNGKTWKNFYGDPAFGTESISAVAYDSRTHSIWASCAHAVEATGQSLPEGSGLRFSLDGGVTWKTVPQPTDSPSDTIEQYGNNKLRALPVTVKVQNISYDIAITRNVIWMATFAGGLRKIDIDTLIASPNTPWERVVLPPDTKDSIKPTDTLNFCLSPVAGKFCGESNLNYRVFSLAAVDDTILFVGTANGINRTMDAGRAANTNDLTWHKYKFLSGNTSSPSGNFVVAMDYNELTKTLGAATWKAEGLNERYGISFTNDLGLNWKRTLLEEKAHNLASVNNLTIAAADAGPFRSYDLGNSWILPGPIVDSVTHISLRTHTFYAAGFGHNGAHLWLGSDDGLVFQRDAKVGWGANWKVFIASPKVNQTSESICYPNPFAPGKEVLYIKYSTGAQTASVTIRIFNFAIQYVRTIIQDAPRGNMSHQVNSPVGGVNGILDVWDGKDDVGNIVPNGVYFYRIDIGSDEPLFGKIVVMR